MNRVFRASFLTIAVFCFSSLFSHLDAATSPLASNLREDVRALFEKWDNSQSPGCSIAVIQNGEFILRDSFGMADLEHGIKLAPTSMFYACSVSKQFVAMCALLLEEEGRLALDDNIRKYLPDFPDYGSPITIRHLLHHTSGIRDYFGLWQMAGNDFQDYMPAEAVYELIRRQKSLNFLPGEKHLYSNSCYFLLYRIIEKVSGKTLREYADENIFKPLGMKHSFFHDDYRRLIPDRAMGYYPSTDHDYLNMISRFDLVGSGGMFTCVEDFLPWDRNFYSNQLGKKDQGLIEKMVTSGKLNNGDDAGYALALVPGSFRGLEIIEHSGSLGGYRTHYLRFPDQHFSVVILSNVSDFNPSEKARRVAELYLKKIMMPIPEKTAGQKNPSPQVTGEMAPFNKSASAILTRSRQLEYNGSYYSEELDCVYRILAEKDKLRIQIHNNPAIETGLSGADEFKGPSISIKFNRDRQNQITSFTADSEGVKNIIFTKQFLKR